MWNPIKSSTPFLSAALLAVATTGMLATGCGDDEGDSYENHVELTCNGSVIVDETFTSFEACADFRDSNTFMCGSIELTVSC